MSNYTPGPWGICGQSPWDVVNMDTGVIYSDSTSKRIAVSIKAGDGLNAPDEDETEANATLIAAAPDLLEKLETAVAIIDMMMDAIEATPPEACQQDFIAMVETIKQARGEP